MNISEIKEMLGSNKEIIKSKEFIQKILNMKNNLIGYDSLNRILIQLQCEDAFDVRTADEWNNCGRAIRKEEKPIWIILPTYETNYVYSDTGEIADVSDMNTAEKAKAIELNIVNKESKLKNIRECPVYDIRQTIKTINDAYEVSKPILSRERILEIFKNITGATVELNDEYFYGSEDNELFIPKVEYKEFASMIANAFAKYFVYILETDGTLDKLQDYIEISISTLLRGNVSKNVEDAQDIKDIIQILEIIDGIVENLTNNIEYTGRININGGAAQNIGIIKKAEVVVDILTAVYTNVKLVNS